MVRRPEYNTEDALELYHKWSEEAGHNLTMAEVRKKDEKYATFLYNRKTQNKLDISIIPLGKRGRKGNSKKWVNWSFEERIRYSIESQFEDKIENPSFNLTQEGADSLDSEGILGKLGYEIVDRNNASIGVNFKVRKAS